MKLNLLKLLRGLFKDPQTIANTVVFVVNLFKKRIDKGEPFSLRDIFPDDWSDKKKDKWFRILQFALKAAGILKDVVSQIQKADAVKIANIDRRGKLINLAAQMYHDETGVDLVVAKYVTQLVYESGRVV